MQIEIGGEETVAAAPEELWRRLNDPTFLDRCIPGCRSMTAVAPDAYRVELQLKVAAVGGSFTGEVTLSDKQPPSNAVITVSGEGTLGQGTGRARFEIVPQDDGTSLLRYEGSGEIGGLVAGVGQRVLKGVAKHLVGRFFAAAKQELATNNR